MAIPAIEVPRDYVGETDDRASRIALTAGAWHQDVPQRCEIDGDSVVAAIPTSVRAASTTPAVSSDSKLATGKVSSTGTVRWCLPGWMGELRACAHPTTMGGPWSMWGGSVALADEDDATQS